MPAIFVTVDGVAIDDKRANKLSATSASVSRRLSH
jgi:hypothetical protein